LHRFFGVSIEKLPQLKTSKNADVFQFYKPRSRHGSASRIRTS
jgi:hypothetical protein